MADSIESLKIWLPGRPVPKKNNPRIIPAMGKRRPLLLPSLAYTQYVKHVEHIFWDIGNIQYTEPVQVCATIYLQDNRRPDLINVLQGIADLLEHYKVLKNDRLIESWDGSRIIGVRKGNPGVDVLITLMNEPKGE